MAKPAPAEVEPKPTLADRLKRTLKLADVAASMIPQDVVPPPEKVEEVIPSLDEVITDKAMKLKLVRLLRDQMPWAEQERAAKKARKPLVSAIKKILGQFQVGKAAWEGNIINYFSGKPRKSINEDLLIAALTRLGVQPKVTFAAILESSKVGQPTYTLRITPIGAEEDEGE